MVHRLFAVLLSVLLALGGGTAAAWPALVDSSPTSMAVPAAQQAPGLAHAVQAAMAAQDVAALLAADDVLAGAGSNDDWSPSATAEPLVDVSALPPLPQRCFANGMRGAPPPRPVMALYQPPDLAGPQRPPCSRAG